MGISVKHVLVVAVIFSFVGFVYVLGFAEIDESDSPRAGALGLMGERASVGWMINGVRRGMAIGDQRSARLAGNSLGDRYPDDPRAWLYKGFAYRMEGRSSAEAVERRCWERLIGLVEGGADGGADGLVGGGADMGGVDDEFGVGAVSWDWMGTSTAREYFYGWALRGLGRVEESRAEFARLAWGLEDRAGILMWKDSFDVEPDGVPQWVGTSNAYNLACYWSAAGEIEIAIAYWRVCVEGGYDLDQESGWWRVDPDFEDLRGDIRFWEIGGVSVGEDERARGELGGLDESP